MNDPDRGDSTPAYVFGHSDRELDRLTAQARLIDHWQIAAWSRVQSDESSGQA